MRYNYIPIRIARINACEDVEKLDFSFITRAM